MEPTLILAAIGVLLISLVLSRGIDRIMRRIGVGPARPESRARGFGDVLDRVRDRLNRRQR
jgi:uncharacterized membrane protein